MVYFKPAEAAFKTLKDKVVVMSGAATGIGAATARILHDNGARVVFGDINVEGAQEMTRAHAGMGFVKCDVTKYADLHGLFKAAYSQHGRVDHAVSCAGILEQGNWFDPGLTMDSVSEPGNTKVMDINVMGTLNFARVAAVFLREGHKTDDGQDKSLMLLSSVNAWRESPGLYQYQTSKHAIQGLLRSSRKTLYERDGIRVNAVCPGVTDTPMTAPVIGAFKREGGGLYWQSADSVARIIVGMMGERGLVGKAVYVEGGEGWEVEEGFYREQPAWMGEEACRRMRVNAEAVMRGALVVK